jgi:peptidoglycan/LPS O-acetylase OafA/YrhL
MPYGYLRRIAMKSIERIGVLLAFASLFGLAVWPKPADLGLDWLVAFFCIEFVAGVCLVGVAHLKGGSDE